MNKSISNEQHHLQHQAQLKLMLMNNNMQAGLSQQLSRQSPSPHQQQQYSNVSPLSMHNQQQRQSPLIQQFDNNNNLMMRQQQATIQQSKYPFLNSSNVNPQINKFSQPLSQQYMQQLHSYTHSSDNLPSRQQLQYQIQNSNFSTQGKNNNEKSSFNPSNDFGQNSLEGSRSMSPTLNHLFNENKERQSVLQSGYQQRIAQALNTQSQISAASADQLPQLSDLKTSTNTNLRTSYQQFLTQSSPKPFGNFNGNNIISDLTIGGYSSQNQSNQKAQSTFKNTNQYGDYNEAIRQLKKKKLELKNNQNISHKQNDFTFANNTEQTTTPKLQDSGDYEKRQETLPLLNQFIQKPVIKLTQNGVQSFYNVEEMEQTLSFKSKLKISQPHQVQILKHILDSGENQKRLRKDLKSNHDFEGNTLSQSQKIIPIHPQKHQKMEQNINLQALKGGLSPHLNHIFPNLSSIGMQYPRQVNSNFNTSLPNLSNQKISQSQSINVENLEQQQLGDLSLENIQKIAIDKYLQDLSLSDLQQIVRVNQASSLIQNSTANDFANSISISTQQNNMGYMGSAESQRGLNLTPQPISSNYQDSSPFAKHIKSSIINDNDEKSKSPVGYQISQQISIKEKTKFGVPPTQQVMQVRPINSQLQFLPLAPKSRITNSRQKMRSISNFDSKKYNDYNQITNEPSTSPQQWPLTPMMQSNPQSDQEANKTPTQKFKIFNFPNDPTEEAKTKYQQESIFVQNQQENYLKQIQNCEEEIKVADPKSHSISPFTKPFVVNYKQKNPSILGQEREQFFQQMNQPPQSNGGITSNSLCTSADLRSPLIKTPVGVHPPVMLPILASMPPSPNMQTSKNYKGFSDHEENTTNLKHPPSIGDIYQTQHLGMIEMPGFEGSTPQLRSLEERLAPSFNLNQDSSSKNFGLVRSSGGFQSPPNNQSQASINQEEINMAENLVQRKREITMLKDIRDMLQQLNTFRNNQPEPTETQGASPSKQNAEIQCSLPNEVAIQTDIIAPNSQIPLNDPKEFLKYIKEHLMDLKAEVVHQETIDHQQIEDFRRGSLNVPKSVKQKAGKQISYHKLLSQNSQVVKTQSDEHDDFFNSKIDIIEPITIHRSQDITKNIKSDSFEQFNHPVPYVVPLEESPLAMQLHIVNNELATDPKQGVLSNHPPALQPQVKMSQQHLSTQRLIPSVKGDSKRNTINQIAGQRRSSMKQSKKSSGMNLENHVPHHVHFTEEKPTTAQKDDFLRQKSAKRSEYSEGRKTANSRQSKKTDVENKSSKSKKKTIIIINNNGGQGSGLNDSSVFDRKKTIKINLNSLDDKIQQGIKHIFQTKSPLLSRQTTQFQGSNNMTRQGTLSIARQGTTYKLQDVSPPPEPELPLQQQKTVMHVESVPKEKRKVNNKLNFAQNLLFKIAPTKKEKKTVEMEPVQENIEIVSNTEDQKSNVPDAPKGRRRYQDYIKKEDGEVDQTNTNNLTVNEGTSQNNSPHQTKKNVEQIMSVNPQQYQFTHNKSYSQFTKKADGNKINNKPQTSADRSPSKTKPASPNNQARPSIKIEIPRKSNNVYVPPLKLPLAKINNNSYELSSSSSNNDSNSNRSEKRQQTLSTQKSKFLQVGMLKEVQEQFEDDTSGTNKNKNDTKNTTQQSQKFTYVIEKKGTVKPKLMPQETIKTFQKMDTQMHPTGRLGPISKQSSSSVNVNHQKTKEIFQSKIRQIPMMKMSSSSMLRFGKLM